MTLKPVPRSNFLLYDWSPSKRRSFVVSSAVGDALSQYAWRSQPIALGTQFDLS